MANIHKVTIDNQVYYFNSLKEITKEFKGGKHEQVDAAEECENLFTEILALERRYHISAVFWAYEPLGFRVIVYDVNENIINHQEGFATVEGVKRWLFDEYHLRYKSDIEQVEDELDIEMYNKIYNEVDT